MSNLRSQHLPITFQLSNGSCKIRNTFALNNFLHVNHARVSIFHSQAANIPIYFDKMKNCVHVWKSRNLTYTGKTFIVKNLLISLCGYEIEMRGIPKNALQKIKTLVLGFIWGGIINQIDRNVCCLGVENGNTGMINMQEIIESKSIPNFT
jgi:hypothetical protein